MPVAHCPCERQWGRAEACRSAPAFASCAAHRSLAAAQAACGPDGDGVVQAHPGNSLVSEQPTWTRCRATEAVGVRQTAHLQLH